MIKHKPKIVRYGFGFGILGGIIAMVATTFALDIGASSTVAYVSLNLLVTVLFFAVGGSFASNGPGSWGAVTFMTALTTGTVIAVSLYGSMNLWFGIILTIIGIFTMLAAVSSTTGRWIKTDRMSN